MLNKLIYCFEHYNGIIIYFISDSYLLASVYLGFPEHPIKKAEVFYFYPKTLYKMCMSEYKNPKVAQIASPSKLGAEK